MVKEPVQEYLEKKVKALEGELARARQNEETLRRSEMKWRSIVKSSPDGIVVASMDGLIEDVSRSALRIFGYDQGAAIVGRHFFSFLDPAYRQEAAERIEKLLGGIYAGLGEYGAVKKDGTGFLLEANAELLRNGRGEPTRIIVTIRDVTDHRRMEESIREGERRYRELADFLPQPVCEFTLDGTLTFANRSCYECFGYTEEDFQRGLNVLNMIDPGDYQLASENIQRVLRGEETIDFDYTLIRNDGSIFPAIIFSSPVIRDGNPVGLRSILIDITDRKNAESQREEALEALRESESTLRSVFKAAPVGLCIMGDRVFLSASDAWYECFGYSEAAIIGQTGRIYFETDYEYKRVGRAIYANLAKRELVSVETKLRREDGALREVILTAGPLHSHKPSLGTVFAIEDITDRRRTEEALSRAEKMEALGTLAGGVAHDLNNVLGVLVGYSELLGEKLPENGQERRYADRILQSSIRASAIIQDLLTLARRGVIVSEVVNLNSLVADYLGTPEHEELCRCHRGATITTELAEGLLNIKGSPVHLGKTIMNLVSNAAESIRGSGKITIGTENRYLDRPFQGYEEVSEGEYVLLTVRDSGGGISQDDLGSIFEPFYTRKVMGRSGTGLGLAVVWGVVKDHKGFIDVQTSETTGSTFTLYFPSTREEAASTDETTSAEILPGEGESILVVDDVEEQRELAETMLERLGYRVFSVSGGEEAVQYLKDNKADLVLLDMIMDPGIDGMETYKRICEISPGQKAVIVSGFSETARVRNTLEMGAGAFVKKPYILEIIGGAIRNELDRI